MTRRSYSVLVILFYCLIPMSSIVAIAENSRADYPWIHYFERPEMPDIHCAFADNEGNVIVSTGDWNDTVGIPPHAVRRYWSEGLYRLNCESVERIECPGNTFVLDGAVDSQGTTWLLMAQGIDGHVDALDLRHSAEAKSLSSDVGYRGPGLYLCNYRFARLEGATLIEDQELTKAVPEKPVAMCSDRWGRIYVFSWRWSESKDARERKSFVSWWANGQVNDLHVCEISNIFPGANMDPYVGRYPQVGPDGLAYFLVGNAWDFLASTEYAVLCLDVETERWELYEHQDSPLQDSTIRCFLVDSVNVKWFGTEDGLVRFDGESWTRFTPENSNLAFNIIRNIGFDNIDATYYVISQGYVDGEYPTAMSYLGLDGQFRAHSDHFAPLSFLPARPPLLLVDTGQVWWFRPYVGDSVFSYDHRRIIEWYVGHWLERTAGGVGYIGCTSTGRRFCATYYAVMIW